MKLKKIGFQGNIHSQIKEFMQYFLMTRSLTINEDNVLVGIAGSSYIDLDEYRYYVFEDKELIESFLESLKNAEELIPNYNITDAIVSLFIIDQEIIIDNNDLGLGEIAELRNNIKKVKETLTQIVNSNKAETEEVINVLFRIKGFQDKVDDKLIQTIGTKDYNIFRENFNKNMHRYLLQLLNENVFDISIFLDTKFLEKMELSEVVDFYVEGMVPIELLTNSKFNSKMNNAQLRKLIENGFFDQLDIETISKLFNSKFICLENLMYLYEKKIIDKSIITTVAGGSKEVLGQFENAVKTKNKRKIGLYFELLDDYATCTLYSRGRITLEDLIKKGITKDTLKTLPESLLIQVIKRGLPDGIDFSYDELIDMKISAEGLLEIYNPNKLFTLIKSNHVDINFINRINTELLSSISIDERKDFVETFISICKNKLNDEEFSKLMIKLIQENALPEDSIKNLQIPENALMDMFLDDTLTEETIIEYFNKEIIDEKSIEILFENRHNEIIELVNSGTLSKRAFCIFTPEECLEFLYNNKLTPETVFSIYANYNSISTEELSIIFNEYGEYIENRINVVGMIDDTLGFNKIKELRLAKVLSHQDLFELEEKGIITEKQREELEKMDLAIKFNQRFNDENKTLDNLEEELLRMQETVNSQNEAAQEIGTRTTKIPAVERLKFFAKLGANLYQDIQTINSQGKIAPFAGYTLFGLPKYGLVVLENLHETNNATYIMTMQEFDTYIVDETEDKVTFTKSKMSLRNDLSKQDGKAIGYCIHNQVWGKRFIEIMQRLSKDARENISQEEFDELSSWMREEYFKARLQGPRKAADQAKQQAELEERELAKAKELYAQTRKRYESKKGKMRNND